MNASITPTPRLAPSADDLGQQIEALRADLVKLAATITNDVSGGLENTGRQIGRTGRDVRASATDTVLGHPLSAIGVAASLGLLLGLILRRG
jgi:ElaB/YqjD/DUF883 family membrane-anchored ribosome-binding protein